MDEEGGGREVDGEGGGREVDGEGGGREVVDECLYITSKDYKWMEVGGRGGIK